MRMKKKLFNELKESINQAIEHAESNRNNLQTIVRSDNADFVLTEEQWQVFNRKLKAPARNVPDLRKTIKRFRRV